MGEGRQYEATGYFRKVGEAYTMKGFGPMVNGSDCHLGIKVICSDLICL